jgi:hypothetical protein
MQAYLLDPDFHSYVDRVEGIWEELENCLALEIAAVEASIENSREAKKRHRST